MQATQSVAEHWRPVPGYESFYEVSDLGRVRGVTRKVYSGGGRMRTQVGRVLRPGIINTRYLVVALRDGFATKSLTVHRLVLLAFVGPCPPGMEVRHLDGDRTNARLDNLAYDTHSENLRDIARHGRHYLGNRTHCDRGHEFTPENTYVRKTERLGTARRCRTCERERSRARKALEQSLKHARHHGE